MIITESKLRGIIRSVLKEAIDKEDLKEFSSKLDGLFRTGYFDLFERKDPSIVKQMGMGFPGGHPMVVPTEAWNSLRKDLLNSYVKELTTENAVTFFYEKVKNHYEKNKNLYFPYLKISRKVTYVPDLIFDLLFHCYMWDIHGNNYKTPGSGRAWRYPEEGKVFLEEYLDTRDAFIRSLSLPNLNHISMFT